MLVNPELSDDVQVKPLLSFCRRLHVQTARIKDHASLNAMVVLVVWDGRCRRNIFRLNSNFLLRNVKEVEHLRVLWQE